MNLKSVYNLKAWINYLSGIVGLLGVLVGMIPQGIQGTKLAIGFGAFYAIMQGILAQLTKAAQAGLVIVALCIGLALSPQRASASGNEHFFLVPTKLTVRQDTLEMPRPHLYEAVLITPVARKQALSTSNLDYAFIYDFKHRESIPVASYKINEIQGFAGKFTLEVWGYAGLNVTTQRGVAGMAVVAPWKAAKNLTIYVGVAGMSEVQGKLSLVPIVSISFAPK